MGVNTEYGGGVRVFATPFAQPVLILGQLNLSRKRPSDLGYILWIIKNTCDPSY
jgi:hypothetical protein